MHFNNNYQPKKSKLANLTGDNRAVQTLVKFLLTYTGLMLFSTGCAWLADFAQQQHKLEYLRKKLRHRKFLKRWLDGIDKYYKTRQQQGLATAKPSGSPEDATPPACSGSPALPVSTPRLQVDKLQNLWQQFQTRRPTPSMAGAPSPKLESCPIWQKDRPRLQRK